MGPVLLERNPGTATSYANTAIDIELRGDEYIARIKDPFADHALYAEAFQAMGLDIGVELIPASPTRVGEVVRYGFRPAPLRPTGSAAAWSRMAARWATKAASSPSR